jgi:hypothetical protein
MKKTKQKEKQIIEALEKVPNISLACEKVGITRQTFYRWMDEDINFLKKINKAQRTGNEYVNDLAESSLITNIKAGKKWSIIYWLDHHKSNYMKPKPKDFWHNLYREDVKKLGGHFIIDTNGQVSYYDKKGKKHVTNLADNDEVFNEIRERYQTVTFEIVDASRKDEEDKG